MNQLRLPAGTTHVRFSELAHQIADALHPDVGRDDERFTYGAARVNLDDELKAAVTRGTLPVIDPLTHGPHTFPHGEALNGALVTVDDLRRFVEGRAITVLVGEPQDTAALEDAPVWHAMSLHSRLRPRTPWRGGRIVETDKLTLQDAAAQASEHAGKAVTVGDFRRASANGEIEMRAVVHRDAKTRPVAPGMAPLNEGRPVPAGSIPTLPLDACKQLAIIDRATWRTFEQRGIINGLPCHFIAWELEPGEPDFETTLDDCRVTGYDVHALADAFAPENDSAATERLQAAPERAEDEPPYENTPPIAAAPAEPAPLPTGHIAFCFAGLRWKTEQEWKKPLGDVPKWLEACRVSAGRRGVCEASWNPVLIGAALVNAGDVTARSVRAKFQTKHLLKPWLEAWKIYEADNPDTP